MGWRARVLFLVGARGSCLLHSVYTSFRTHKSPYLTGTAFFFGFKAAWAVKLAAPLHLVQRPRMVELHLHSPIRLHTVLRSWLRHDATSRKVVGTIPDVIGFFS
jgi:hypothetical protein